MWARSVYSAKDFENVFIKKSLRKSKLPRTLQTIGKNNFNIPNYLTADPVYPLGSHCIKQYHSCKSN